MSTTQQDNLVIAFAPPVEFPIKTDATADINGGDLVYFDTSAYVVKSLDSDAHAQYFVGMAGNGSYINVYGTKKYFDSIPVYQKAQVRLKTTAAETYYEATAVYAGADAQTITTVAGSYLVGYCKMSVGATSVTGATGTLIEVMLYPRYPGATAGAYA
jgi:hypothetical protein